MRHATSMRGHINNIHQFIRKNLEFFAYVGR